MKEHAKARYVVRKTFKIMKIGLCAVLGGTVGGVVGLVQGMSKGVVKGAKGDFICAVTEVLNK